MTGGIVGIYPPEELKKMTAAEVNEVIRRDISENTWESQKKEPVHYRGRKPAEHLETFLFLCPECGEAHRLESCGAEFCCTACGKKSRMLDTGFLEGDFRFRTIREWGVWQEEELAKRIDASGDEPIFTDDAMKLVEVTTAKKGNDLGTGTITLYADRLELPAGITVPASEISGLSIRGASVLFVGTSEGKVYQVIPQGVRNTQKYILACRRLGLIDIAV